jgi:hypothetical protein
MSWDMYPDWVVERLLAEGPPDDRTRAELGYAAADKSHNADGCVPECHYCGKPIKKWKKGETCPDRP